MNRVSKWLLEVEKFFPKNFKKIREVKRSSSSICIGYGSEKEKIIIHQNLKNFWIYLPNNYHTNKLEEAEKGRCFSMPEYLKKRINVNSEEVFQNILMIIKKTYK